MHVGLHKETDAGMPRALCVFRLKACHAARELQDFHRCSTEPRVDPCGSQSIWSHGELWNDACNNSLISGLLLISGSLLLYFLL